MENMPTPSLLYWIIQIAIWFFCFLFLLFGRKKQRSSTGKTSLGSKIFQIILTPFLVYLLLLYIAAMLNRYWKIKWDIFYENPFEYVIAVSVLVYLLSFLMRRKR
jgi:hypothetical protein